MKTDFLIIGGGIVGLTIAHALRGRYPTKHITVLEKEEELAAHGSGRNSGVLHSGVYYAADSLKARFCRDGNLRMRAFCQEHGIAINENYKLIIAQNDIESERLETLAERANVNEVPYEMVSVQRAKEIEPYVRTQRDALFSPSTATVDPHKVMHTLRHLLESQNVRIEMGSAYVRHQGDIVETSKGEKIEATYVINCAGLYADKIARQYGACLHYTILPFKGVYLQVDASDLPLKTNLYPVPDPQWPFLGVHFTVDVKGRVKIGPTAMPAFWRENYEGLKNFNMFEMLNILKHEARLFTFNAFHFRDLAIDEMRKFSKKYLLKQALKMVESPTDQPKHTWYRPGIRSQLLDLRNDLLVQDFIMERTSNSLHVLNAVSPAFTCSFAFASWIVDQI